MGSSLRDSHRATEESEEAVTKEQTDYAVRVYIQDGTTIPWTDEGLDWVSKGVAKKIAAKLWDARQRVVNSEVIAIEIIDAGYETVQIHRFNEEKEEDNV